MTRADQAAPYSVGRVIATIEEDIRKRTGRDAHVDEHNAVECLTAPVVLQAALPVTADAELRGMGVARDGGLPWAVTRL
ncbi:MAG TPA: hypothetical protein VH496_08965 [Mycobacterium sp.]|jgi:hypothetical protein